MCKYRGSRVSTRDHGCQYTRDQGCLPVGTLDLFWAAFPLTPKRTFLRPKDLSNTSRILGLGVRKIPNFGCIRPFVFSRTYMNAQQALRPIKYYFICMKISRPVEAAGCLGSRRILTYFHSFRRARERILWHNVCPPKARSAAFTLLTNL